MTAKNRILVALKVAGRRGCTTAELCGPDVGGVRFGGRIKELRDAGYEIEAFYVRRGSHRYVLVSEPAEVTAVTTSLHGAGGGSGDLGESSSGPQGAAPSTPSDLVARDHAGSADGGSVQATPETPREAADSEGLFDQDEYKAKRQHDQEAA